MDCVEPRAWLDDHGGRWCVRASSAAVLVVATVGGVQTVAPIEALTCDDVDDALIQIVEKVRTGAEHGQR